MNSTSDKPRPLVAAEEEGKISRNVLIWLNTFPDVPESVLNGAPLTPINFEFLKDNVPGMTMSTIQAPYIIKRYITGGYKAEYQFKVIYRMIPGNTTGPDKRLKADELLDRLGDWVQGRTPDLGYGIRALGVEPMTRASLFAMHENRDEDHQILLKMTYCLCFVMISSLAVLLTDCGSEIVPNASPTLNSIIFRIYWKPSYKAEPRNSGLNCSKQVPAAGERPPEEQAVINLPCADLCGIRKDLPLTALELPPDALPLFVHLFYSVYHSTGICRNSSYNIDYGIRHGRQPCFCRLKAEAVEWENKWPDTNHLGLTRSHGSPSAVSLIRSIRFAQVEPSRRGPRYRCARVNQEIEQAARKRGGRHIQSHRRKNMNAVGIDVSKGKSMMAALRPMGEVALRAKEYPHTKAGLEQMALAILALGEDTRAVMEATGRYHEPVAAALHEYGIRVTVMNPLFIKQSGGGSIRKVKTDKADAMKIAKYALDNWVKLREYTPMEAIREQLKLCSRQYNLYMKNVVALTNNLISLTDKVFPGVNELFSSPERADGSVKWVDFVMTFWHCECINLASEATFTERYRKWCKWKGYHFSPQKAAELHMDSAGHITTLPRNSNTRLLITTAAKELASAKSTLAVLRAEMDRLARQLPEYDTVRAMYGVGEKTAPPLIAEIGDVRRFPQRSSISAFAGVDPAVDDSGKHISLRGPSEPPTFLCPFAYQASFGIQPFLMKNFCSFVIAPVTDAAAQLPLIPSSTAISRNFFFRAYRA